VENNLSLEEAKETIERLSRETITLRKLLFKRVKKIKYLEKILLRAEAEINRLSDEIA